MVLFFGNWLIVSFAVWATAQMLPGVHIKDFKAAIGVAAMFGILNFCLGWLLFTVFAIGTLGLAWLFAFITWWVIDAIMLKFTDSMMDSIKIDGFGWALAASAVIALVSSVSHYFLDGLLT